MKGLTKLLGIYVFVIMILTIIIGLIILGNPVSVQGDDDPSVVVTELDRVVYEKEERKIEFVLYSDSTVELNSSINDVPYGTLKGTYLIDDNGYFDVYVLSEYYGTLIKGDIIDWVDENSEEYKYPCSVIIEEVDYGIFKTDVEKGAIGDVVTITPKPSLLCQIDYVTVNGTIIVPNENGEYKFALVKGDNVISGAFIINTEDFAMIAEQINYVKTNNWETLFSLDNIFNLVSWAISLVTGGGLCVALLKLKSIKSKSADEVIEIVRKQMQTEIGQNITSYLNEKLYPILLQNESRSISTETISKTLARCMVLAQENTPESRLAIISELTKLQTSDSDLAVQVQAIIQQEVDKANQELSDKKAAIEELEKANDSIVVKETATEEPETEGRI